MFWQIFYTLCSDRGTKPNPVGKQLGIASSTITQWKQGYTPSGENLIKLADYFNVTTDYLLGRTNNSQSHKTAASLSDEETKLLSYFNGFNSEGKEEAMKRLDEMSALNRYKKPSEVSEKFS